MSKARRAMLKKLIEQRQPTRTITVRFKRRVEPSPGPVEPSPSPVDARPATLRPVGIPERTLAARAAVEASRTPAFTQSRRCSSCGMTANVPAEGSTVCPGCGRGGL